MDYKKIISLCGVGPKLSMQDFGIHGQPENKKFQWLIVCDGIGGMPFGEVAAQTTVSTLDCYFKNELKDDFIQIDSDFFKDGLAKVKSEFIHLIRTNPKYEMMGCTLCAAIFHDKEVYICWSGDTRLYLFRENECFWDTIPHSWVFDLFRKGVLSIEEARVSESNYLTGSINSYSKSIRFDFHKLQLIKDDRLMICTDGIWGLYEHKDFVNMCMKESVMNLESTLRKQLNDFANDNYYGYFVEIL